MIIDNHGLCKELFRCVMAITNNTRRNVSKFGMHCFQAFDHIRYDPELATEGCHFELIKENRYQDMMNHIKNYYVPDELIGKSLNLHWN